MSTERDMLYIHNRFICRKVGNVCYEHTKHIEIIIVELKLHTYT